MSFPESPGNRRPFSRDSQRSGKTQFPGKFSNPGIPDFNPSFLDVRWAISRLSSFTMCNITTSRRGGVRGLAPWSWSIFWVSRCQMKSLLKSFPTSHVFLPSFLLHFLLIPFLPPFLFSLPLWKSSPLLVFPSPLSFFSSIFAGYMFRSVRCFCCLPFT